MTDILIRENENNFLSITPICYSHPEATNKWDINWFKANIELTYDGNRCKFQADLHTYELADFQKGLKKLIRKGKGSAKYESMEQWLEIDIACNPKAGYCVAVTANYQDGTLSAKLYVDNECLIAVLSEVEAVLDKFPVK